MELRGCRNDLHPLAGTVTAAASLSDLHRCTYGFGIHKIPPRMDNVGRAWSYQYLG